MMPMTVTAYFHGGPHDGAEREIEMPAPLVLTLQIGSVVADYHYHGFKDGTAGYGIQPVDAHNLASA